MNIPDPIVKWVPLNFTLLLNPLNWVIVALVVALASVGLAAIISQSNALPDEV